MRILRRLTKGLEVESHIDKHMVTSKISFWQIIRLVFVVFSLYFLGDAFYRWDGFSYHSTFYEFLPSIALAASLWSVVAIFTSIILWILLRIFESFCLRAGYETRAEHLLIFTGFLISSGILAWKAKRLLWPLVQTGEQTKLIILICIFFLSIFLTWLLRNRATGWITYILERITPLVWVFSLLLLISITLLTYHITFKETHNAESQKISPLSPSGKNRQNIILVTFDTLTARDMSVYGYKRETTPFITEWAKKATIFMNMQAASNWTTPSTASLMTGKRVWTHRASHLNGALPEKSSIESLPLELKKQGYFNIAIVANPVASVKTLGIDNSFDIAPPSIEFSTPLALLGGGTEAVGIIDKLLYRLFAEKFRLHDWIIKEDFILGIFLSKISRDISRTTVPPEKVFNKFLEILDDNPPEPFFAWIHLLPPHAPFLPPESTLQMFDASETLKTYKTQWSVFEKRGSYHVYEQFPPEVQPLIDTLRSRYDEFIRYCDMKFEEFIEEMGKRDKLDDTIIILSSDHGESFEHSYLSHGGPFLYEQVTHIPLIIKEPGQTKKNVIYDLVEQIDLTATISELANIPVPEWMEGRSLVPLMRSQKLPAKPAFSMNLEANPRHGQKITNGVISVWEGDFKLIYDLNSEKARLYNLKEDPDELKNMYKQEPDKVKTLVGVIHENIKEVNERIINEH